MIKFENKSNGRFYYMEIRKDLLDYVVVIVFGGSNVTRTRTIACDSRMDLHKELDRLSKRRIGRGYVLVS